MGEGVNILAVSFFYSFCLFLLVVILRCVVGLFFVRFGCCISFIVFFCILVWYVLYVCCCFENMFGVEKSKQIIV